jgi:SET domain-containing protein
MPPIPGLRVIASRIHGYGVVACRDFAPGEIIACVDGILWREEEDRDDTYSLWLDEGWYLDMLDQTRWINHSCDPNAEIEAEVHDGAAWARVIALRAIRAGEEITYDYAFIAELAEPCACGAATCRGLIIDLDELPRLASIEAAEVLPAAPGTTAAAAAGGEPQEQRHRGQAKAAYPPRVAAG